MRNFWRVIAVRLAAEQAVRLAVQLAVGVASVGLAGCAQLRIVADERNPREGEASESVFGWSGDFEGGRKELRVSREASLGAVNVHGSYWRAWGTVLSFGAWQPFEVMYEVNDDEPKGDR